MLRGNKHTCSQIKSGSLIDLVLVAYHVRSIGYLDAAIGQLLHSTSIDELSENICSSIVVLHFLLSSSELYLEVSDLHLVLLFHLIDELLFVAFTLELYLSPSTLGAYLEEMSCATVGCYEENRRVRYMLSSLEEEDGTYCLC